MTVVDEQSVVEVPGPDVPGYGRLKAAPRLTPEVLDPLVRAARTGDPAAVRDLLAVVKPMVVRYCRARMGGRDLSYLSADDVAQEVCLAVFRILPAYEDRGGSFLYLVRGIAAHKIADAFRTLARDRSEPVPELPEIPLVHNEPEARAVQFDLGARLSRLLATLPPVQREILALRVVLGLTSAEAARSLGMSAGSVRISQYRALAKLRAKIAEEEF